MNLKKFVGITVSIIALGLCDVVSAAESITRSGRIRRFANEGCDELIPAFLDQVLKNDQHIDVDGSCDQSGTFPKPGDCTVFFKCLHPRGRIFVEYCAIGYTFMNESCIRNSNATNCPQYDCELLDQADQSYFDDASNVTASIQSDTSQPLTPGNTVLEVSASPSQETTTEVNTSGDKQKEPLTDEETVFAAQQAKPANNDGGSYLTVSATLIIMTAIARGVISGV